MEYNYKPTFRFEPSGDLTLRPSEEALMVARANKEKNYTTVAKNPKKVLSNAKVIVLAQGGDVHDDRLVASENALQFGQYHGKSFRWILSNDVGYAVMILASHQQERRVVTDLSPEMVNKDRFNWYCNLFPEVQRAVEERRVLDGTMPPRPDLDHSHLVGFGDHKKLTYKELYEATDRERKSYMTWFRKIHVKQGTSMARFKVYVEHRDKTAASPNPGAEPSDQELLAVVMEMDNVPTGPEPTARPPTQSVSQPGGGPVQPAAGSSVILPEGWKLTLPREQQEWVSRAIFTTDKHLKCVLKKQLELWYFPPLPPNITHQPPASPNSYFLRPFCLWMPYRLWAFRFVCTQSQCNGRKLTGCGVYKTVRKVLDLDGWYFMGTEYLECSKCKKKWASWSLDVLNQLDPSHRAKFPAILTYRLSCDMKVVRLMRERTLGNSVTRLYSLLREQHSADWMARTLDYLTVCKHYVVPGVAPVKITTPPHIPVPSAQWLLTVHGYDVLFQVEDFKARITSIFGSILKMDSTKKVTKKLAGAAHGTAAWATNVGNEYGQVLITVLTDSEGEGLLNMTTGLQNRYSQAGVAAPKLLYVDRDCCTLMGKGRAAAMFSQWEDLYVRLDIWHFIRRFAGGVTSESHPLYSLFLQRLSSCIFVWCAEDAERLREAKRGELAARRIGGLCDSEINKRITSKEMALHCRRQTRGAEDTERLIGELLECLMNATDTMGIPLLDRDRMKVIWQTQRRHVTCIQDPPGVSLYVKTKSLTKGGVVLPVLRCARGSTSLESFHLHLNRFIPGTSASAEHFQAYLLEGLTRWNEDRAEAAALGDRQQSLHSYDGVAQYAINKLSQELMGCSLVTDYTKPAKYTGELIGVEYLYSQTGGHHQVLDSNLGMDPDVPDGIPEEMETEQSEGVQVEDDEEVDPTILWHSLDENLPPLLPVRSASPSPPAVCLDQEEDEYMGPDRVGGYQHVVLLAKCLVRLLEGPWISNRQANEIVALWERLRDVDKMAVVYPERFRDRVLQGRFRNSKTTVTQGKDSMQRSLLGQGSGPAQWPNISRTVEALFLELCQKHPAGKTVHGVRVNRWAAMLSDYRTIRTMVLGSPHLREQTRLQLFEVNQLTLTQWYNTRVTSMEKFTLHPGTGSMISAREGVGPFDPADDRAAPLTVPEPSTGTYQLPADQGGQAVQRGRGATYQPPLPPQQPTTSHLVATDLPATTTALPPPVGGPTVSRTTLWRARKRLESGKAVRVHKPYMCTKCSQPKTKEYGHSSFKGISFCATTSGGQTLAGWLDLMRSQQGGSTQGQ